MAVERRLRFVGAWVPDDPDADSSDVDFFVDGEDVVFVVVAEDSGELRILLSEFEFLYAELQRLSVDPVTEVVNDPRGNI